MKGRLLVGSLLAGLGLSLALGARVIPLYSDEIAYRFILGRQWLDRGVGFTLLPQCFPASFELPSSTLLALLRWPEAALLSFASPGVIRIWGALLAALLIGCWIAIASRGRSKERGSNWPLVTILGLAGTGLFPWLLSLGRPETPLLVAFAALSWIGLRSTAGWISIPIVFLLGAAALAWHPIAILFSPVVWVALELRVRSLGVNAGAPHPRDRLHRALLRGSLLFAWFALVRLAQQPVRAVLSCPEDPALARLLSSYVVTAQELLPDLWAGFLHLVANLSGNFYFFAQPLFRRDFPYDWLPALAGRYSVEHAVVNSLAQFSWTVLVLVILWGLVLGARSLEEVPSKGVEMS